MKKERIEKTIEDMKQLLFELDGFGVVNLKDDGFGVLKIYGLCNTKQKGMFGYRKVSLGEGEIFNTIPSRRQFNVALSLGKEKEYINAKEMIKDKPLEGLKIIDLGCGWAPAFARLSRNLGAVVYTLDVISAEKISESLFSSSDELVKEEELYHIEVDLNEKDVLDRVKQKVGIDSFDLVTHSNLFTPTFTKRRDGKDAYIPKRNEIFEIAKKMLKEGGIYYSPSGIGMKVNYSGVSESNFYIK